MSYPWRPVAVLASLVVGVSALLTACAAGSDPSRPESAAQPAPPAPPAACVLDTAALAATTGLTWTPDETTATDARCVYDPDGDPTGIDFVAVDIAPSRGADTELDTLAGLCEDGSRAPVAADGSGFVCRFQGGSVFAALVRGGQVVTVAASAVPPGTTAARLVVAFTQQLSATP
ncbi:MAG: hypothetical protein ACR2GH_15835 [Pseudonocardia sp.]